MTYEETGITKRIRVREKRKKRDGLDESSPYIRKKLKGKKQMGTMHRAST